MIKLAFVNATLPSSTDFSIKISGKKKKKKKSVEKRIQFSWTVHEYHIVIISHYFTYRWSNLKASWCY